MFEASARLCVLVLVSALAAVGALATPAEAKPPAPGAPGTIHRWAPADKHGFGSAHQLESKAWFTLRQGSLSEVYYPNLSTPSFRGVLPLSSSVSWRHASPGSPPRAPTGALALAQSSTQRRNPLGSSFSLIAGARRLAIEVDRMQSAAPVSANPLMARVVSRLGVVHRGGLQSDRRQSR